MQEAAIFKPLDSRGIAFLFAWLAHAPLRTLLYAVRLSEHCTSRVAIRHFRCAMVCTCEDRKQIEKDLCAADAQEISLCL